MTAPDRSSRRPLILALALIGLDVANMAAWALGGYIHAAVFVLLLAALLFACVRDLREGWMIATLAALAALAMLGTPLKDWDARSIWFFHAKEIYFGGSLYAQLSGYGAFSHNDYPVLLSAIAASLARSLGTWNEIFPRLAFLWLLAPVLVVYRIFIGRDVAFMLLFAAVLLACDYQLVSGCMDAVMALFFGAAALLLGEVYRPKDAADLAGEPGWPALRATLLAVMIVLPNLKNEGLLALLGVYACLLPKALATLRREPTFAQAARGLPWLAPLLLYAALWWLPMRLHGIQGDLLVPGVFTRAGARLSSGADLVLIGTAEFVQTRWFLLLLAGALAVTWWRPATRDRSWRAPLALLAIYLAGMSLVYCATPQDLFWHVYSSVDRTMLSVDLGILAAVAWRFGARAYAAPAAGS
jgi:hypothetical protein